MAKNCEKCGIEAGEIEAWSFPLGICNECSWENRVASLEAERDKLRAELTAEYKSHAEMRRELQACGNPLNCEGSCQGCSGCAELLLAHNARIRREVLMEVYERYGCMDLWVFEGWLEKSSALAEAEGGE